MGYYREGRYVSSERFDGKRAFDLAKTKQAVADCLLAVQTGTMTSKQALRQLLPEFPLLRKERRRQEKQHMLQPFIDYYVAETLGRTWPPKSTPKVIHQEAFIGPLPRPKKSES